jgi:lipoprotein-anchoring transpeptidase ErfK/SrfK
MADDEIINEGPLPEVEKTGNETVTPDKKSINQIINSLFRRLLAAEKHSHFFRNVLHIFLPVLLVCFVMFFVLYFVPVLQEIRPGHKTQITNDPEIKKDPGYKKQISLTTKDIERLSRKFSAYTSGQSYIVFNTTDNKFYLYKNKKLIREGICSTGSYTMLKTESGKKWIFKTPRGKYYIQGKITNPVWKRPDWAFVEEGLAIPSANDDSRFEYGVLGDYALILGDGYMIHGTIYKRFLGMPVTHGCVRLNDADLEAIFNTLSIGSKVYIF